MPDISYAHVLLFSCPNCVRPLAAICVNTKRSLEVAEAEWFAPHCHCGWTGIVAGGTAIRHWVEPWPHVVPQRKGVPGSCDGDPLPPTT